MKTKQDIANLLNKLPHKMQVEFAVHCCNDIKHLIADSKSLKTLELVEKWLKNPELVTAKELLDAAHAAYAAAYAAHAAANAANAANSAAHAANSAAHAANSAAHAAYYNNYDAKIDQYCNDLVFMCQNLTDLEKVIFNVAI